MSPSRPSAQDRPRARRTSARDRAFLASYRIEDYDRPSVAADIVALTLLDEETGDWRAPTRRRPAVLLVRRGRPPFQGLWALPGGFLQRTGTLEQCARRELREETGLEASALLSLDPVSTPGRDPRGWILSCPYLCIVASGAMSVRGGDDAANAVWTPLDSLPRDLAFDHADILAAALRRLRTDPAAHDLSFAFLPESFTLAELRDVFRLFGISDDTPANFRRKILPFVQPAGGVRRGEGHRPATLYRRAFPSTL